MKYLQNSFYNQSIKELKKAEDRVAWLLNKFRHLRNSDKLLVFYYWHFVDGYEGGLSDAKILSLSNAETIRRVRAKIQNKYKLFLPTDPEVKSKRKIKEEAYRDWAVSETKLGYV